MFVEHSRFASVRRHQTMVNGRTLTPFDTKVGDVIFHAARLAMEDVIAGRPKVRVVSAPTGSGKSQSSIALAVAGLRQDPTFSAAFVVETASQAEQVYRDIVALLDDEETKDVVVWSTAHDIGTTDDTSLAEYKVRPERRFARADLRRARIVIVTHRKWMAEMTRGADTGVRHLQGRPRSLIFIDENPNLVKLVSLLPGQLHNLRDALYSADAECPWVAPLDAIWSRMQAAFEASGPTYIPVSLVEPEEAASLPANPEVMQKAAVGVPRHLAESCLDFIRAAAKGCVFLSRNPPMTFLAYDLQFEPTPGCVLLDATADISGIVPLMAEFEGVEVPAVDFGRLEIVHLAAPGELPRKMSDITAKASSARAYSAWIRATVLEHTCRGDRVLVVAHKELFDHEYLEASAEPDAPRDWEGRDVFTLHWGTGIGSNIYKEATHVFLFGEFHVPRATTIATALGYMRKTAREAELSRQAGQTLTGEFKRLQEGHLLRWTKQLACRGNVRNIDAQGRCGPMKLFTSMDLFRLMRFRDTLFPGAALPMVVDTNEPSNGRPVDRLVRLLATSDRTAIPSAEVAALTGVRACDLSVVLRRPSVALFVSAFGWTLSSAKALGGKGKGKVLVKVQDSSMDMDTTMAA